MHCCKQAKESLCTAIDDYLRVKIQLADEAISEYCGTVINNGDVILVYAQYVGLNTHTHMHMLTHTCTRTHTHNSTALQ